MNQSREPRYAQKDLRSGLVRSASLLEQRGFEPPVPFGSFAPETPFEIRPDLLLAATSHCVLWLQTNLVQCDDKLDI